MSLILTFLYEAKGTWHVKTGKDKSGVKFKLDDTKHGNQHYLSVGAVDPRGRTINAHSGTGKNLTRETVGNNSVRNILSLRRLWPSIQRKAGHGNPIRVFPTDEKLSSEGIRARANAYRVMLRGLGFREKRMLSNEDVTHIPHKDLKAEGAHTWFEHPNDDWNPNE